MSYLHNMLDSLLQALAEMPAFGPLQEEYKILCKNQAIFLLELTQ